MSDRKLGFVVWRDALTHPPSGDGMRRILALHSDGKVEDCDACYLTEEEYVLWTEMPSPPGDDAPTLKDLQRAHDALLYASGNLDHGILTVVYPEECDASATRLRRAIEEAER